MTSIDQALPSRSAPSKNNIYFGFIPQSVIARFQSSDYQQRVDASSELLELIQNSDFADVDVHSLLMFIEPYANDQNYLIAQNVEQVISSVINQTVLHSLTCAPYLHQIVHIVLLMFEDRRRTVCQLGQDILVDLLSANDHYAVISEVVRSSSAPHPKVSVEVFRCYTNLITQSLLEPSTLLQFPFYFDAMLLSPLKNVKQSVLWCIDYIKNHHVSEYNTLISLLSRETAAVVGKGVVNPTTAVPKNRQDTIVVNRVLNTAGIVEAAKAKASFDFSRSMPLSRNQYQRPSLPSGKGARQINFLASMSRPVSSKSVTTFLDDDQPPNFVSMEEETQNKDLYSIPNPSTVEVTQQSNIVQSLPPLKEASENPDPSFSSALNSSNRRNVTEPVINNTTSTTSNVTPKKKAPPQPKKRLITFDASVFPAKSDETEAMSSAKKQRHISFAQTPGQISSTPSYLNQLQQVSTNIQGNLTQNGNSDSPGDTDNNSANDSDRPIKSSGFYNIGDDINFPSDNISETKLSNIAKKKKPQFSTSLKRPPPKKHPQSSLSSSLPKTGLQARLEVHPQPQKPPKIEKIIEKLKSDEWSDQNDSINELNNSLDQLIQGVNTNLREIVTSLLECSASLRSMLAKNALNCLQKMIKSKSIDFEPISDMCASSLLQLITAHKSKHFIYELSGDTFAALIESISVNKATDILKNEYQRKHDDARAKVAFCISSLVQRTNDFSPLLKPLVSLVQDRNPDVRKQAKSAVVYMKAKSPSFNQLLAATFANDDERMVLQAI